METILLTGAAMGYYVFVGAEIALGAYVVYKVAKTAKNIFNTLKLKKKVKDGKFDATQVDAKGRTPLMTAKTVTQTNVLIETGIDVNAKDENGKTALMYAAERGDKKSVLQLIEAGADLNALDNNKNSALHYAAAYGNRKTLNALLNSGIDVNTQNNKGKTALMLAAERTYFMAHTTETNIDILLGMGADTTLTDVAGKRALDYYFKNAQDNEYGAEYLKKLSATSETSKRENTKKTMSLQEKKNKKRMSDIQETTEKELPEMKKVKQKRTTKERE